MAKLTESYLRKLIKESISDLYDEVDTIQADNVEDTMDQESRLFDISDEIEEALNELEDGEVKYAIATLKDVLKSLGEASRYAITAHSAASDKAGSMQSAAYRTGMPSASSEFGTTRSMDESRRTRMVPKRK
jgi:hypothetical protein